MQAAGRNLGWPNLNHGYLAYLILLTFSPWGWLTGMLPAGYPNQAGPSRSSLEWSNQGGPRKQHTRSQGTLLSPAPPQALFLAVVTTSWKSVLHVSVCVVRGWWRLLLMRPPGQ